jgi:hypothetical protein
MKTRQIPFRSFSTTCGAPSMVPPGFRPARSFPVASGRFFNGAAELPPGAEFSGRFGAVFQWCRRASAWRRAFSDRPAITQILGDAFEFRIGMLADTKSPGFKGSAGTTPRNVVQATDKDALTIRFAFLSVDGDHYIGSFYHR